MTQTLDYYPYGSQRIATGSFSEQRRFIGEEYDPDTEFSYLNARYYQGSRGQFMSQDPVFLALGDPQRSNIISQQQLAELLADPQVLNAYSYARGNPILNKDPSGNCHWCLYGLIGGTASFYSTWAGDVLRNRAEGKTGLSAYGPSSSFGEYV